MAVMLLVDRDIAVRKRNLIKKGTTKQLRQKGKDGNKASMSTDKNKTENTF